MKKILLSAAIVTGFLAPAIFAAAQYVAYGQENSQGINKTSVTGSGEGITQEKKCMRGVVAAFNREKRKLSDSSKAKIKMVIQESSSQGTVSGERLLRKEKLEQLQKQYAEKLASLKADAITKQRSCIQN